MPDGILSIGATFEKAQLDGDFSSANEIVKAATDGWAASFESSKKATREAAAAMADSVRSFAQNVNVNAVVAAEGLKKVAAAQSEVRLASKLMKDSTVDANFGILAMASAQEKLAAASAEAAPAVKALAAEVAESAVPAASAWQLASLSIRESLSAVQEKLVETAETGKLSGEGMAAGFAGLGSLLGAGIAVGFATHFLDETARVNVELGHLSTMSGIAVTSLAGLRQIVREMGGDWDPIATGLVNMDKALADSTEPSKALVNALGGVGLTLKELQGLSPEKQLDKIAAAFSATANAGNVASAAIAIFGRGGRALIPILKEQGAEMSNNMRIEGEATGVTEKSVAVAREWTRNMAQVTEQLQRLGNAVIENLHWIEAVGAGLGAVLDTIAMSFYTAFNHAREGLAGLGKELYDVLSGNWRDMGKDWDDTMASMVATAAKARDEVASRWKDAADLWKGPRAASDASGAGADSDDADAGAGGGSDSSGRSRAGGRDKPFREYGPPNLFAQDQSTMTAGSAAVSAAADKAAIDQNSAAWRAYYGGIESDANALADMQKRIATANAAADASAQAAGVAAWAKYYQSISDAAAAAQKKQEAFAQEISKDLTKAFADIQGPLNTFVDHWLTSGIRMGAAFQKMYDSMAMSAINALLKMGEKWVMHELLITAAHAAGLATRKSQDAGAAALSNSELMASLAKWVAMEWAKVTHHVAANTAKTTSDITAASASNSAMAAANAAKVAVNGAAATSATGAGAAAAGAEAAVLGPEAALAAASAFAASMTPFIAMAAFDEGGVVQGGGRMGVPILAHAGERVLSQSQTTNFEKMVNQSTSNSSSKEVHFHDHSNWSGVDGASVEGMYKKHAATGRREMMRQLRLANAI